MIPKGISFFLIAIFFSYYAYSWGFYAHKKINRLAVFTLPPEMIRFYKRYIHFITENAINPDQRRYAVEGEAPRHFIDLDHYGDSAVYKLPRYWEEAVKVYTEDTLMAHGINPWFIYKMKQQLTGAFARKDLKSILRISADIGHYIGDAHVPLHTTSNYNGQKTNQNGIHGFWESRLPELFADNYNFFTGKAAYLSNCQSAIWNAVAASNKALDSVLVFEKELTKKFGGDKKYAFEERNGHTVKVYSKDFSEAYHNMLTGQVERRMRAAIIMVGSFWYTAWVDAGQPDLNSLLDNKSEQLNTIDSLVKNRNPVSGKWTNCH